jgi:hypothetical protein
MKKFMFSAVAMIAFVGSSMASTSEVRKVEVLVVEKTCAEKAMDYLDARDPNNVMTSSQAHEVYTSYYSGCVNATKQVSLSVQ